MAHIQQTPVRVALPVSADRSAWVDLLVANITPLLKGTNYTIIKVKSFGAGFRTSGGNYTAFLGQLMGNKADYALYGTVLSGFDYPGLSPSVVVSALSLKLHSHSGQISDEPRDVLDSIDGVPHDVVMYLMIVVHLIAASLASITHSGLLEYLDVTWNSLRCFVAQGNWETKVAVKRLVWLCFETFVFVTIFGYILNLMSTDSFVAVHPRHIETLDDAFDDHFKAVRFLIAKNDFFFNFVQTAKPSSQLGKLYSKMAESSNCSRMETCNLYELGVASDSRLKLFQLFQMLKSAAHKDTTAVIGTNEMSDNWVVPSLCRLQPDILEQLYSAPLAVAEDLLVTFHRDELDGHVKRYLKFTISSIFEFDHFWRFTRDLLHVGLDQLDPSGKTLSYYRCVERKLGTGDDVVIHVSLEAYKRLLTDSAKFIICGIGVLFMELFLLALNHHMRPIKFLRKRNLARRARKFFRLASCAYLRK
ncbi:hypothetical protein HDE_03587 [Halotydeus destructor]|nr:hypothetical protein HDE_03587 [Halotydeus destructor]